MSFSFSVQVYAFPYFLQYFWWVSSQTLDDIFPETIFITLKNMEQRLPCFIGGLSVYYQISSGSMTTSLMDNLFNWSAYYWTVTWRCRDCLVNSSWSPSGYNQSGAIVLNYSQSAVHRTVTKFEFKFGKRSVQQKNWTKIE